MATSEQAEYETTIGAHVSEDLKRKVRMAAASQNMSMSEFIRDVLDEAAEDQLSV